MSGRRHGETWLLTVLTLTSTINWADRQVVPILFPGIRAELGLTDTELGIVGGLAFSLIYAVTGFLFGFAADRWLRIRVVAFGLATWSVATAAGGLATDFTTLFWARFFTGIGEASLFPCAVSLIGERFPPERRGRALGIYGMSAAIGAGLGVGLGGRVADVLGWRTVFFLYGGSGLLLVPLLLTLPEARRPRRDHALDHPVAVVRALLADARLSLLWLAGMTAMASGIGYAAWVPSFFVRDHGLDVTGAGLLFGAAALVGGVAGSLLGGMLADRRGRVRPAGEVDVAIGSGLLAAPLIATTLDLTSPLLFVPVGLLASTAIYAFFPALQSLLVRIVPKERHGTAAALNVFFLGGLGSALGPFVVGRISDASGSLHTALLLPAAGFLVAAVIVALAGRLARRA
ncbi:MAG: MFS transporter [Deltaproteobacteria bacterium]|nr:MFS transporter [Deltaproteobacteria bacterium]